MSQYSWAPAYPNSICKLNGYGEKAVTYIPVVVIGAGESGIAFGCRLKEKLGFDQFRIYDRQAGVGGTWWINRYPGAACDVPAIFYSFSFCQNPKWTSFHPSGLEIVTYLNDVCSQYEITDKIQCDTDVLGCTWIEQEQIWEVHLRYMVPGTGDLGYKERCRKIESEGPQSVYLQEETIRAKIVISAVGGLVEPNDFPSSIPGADRFKGPIFHSARWRQDVDLKGKSIVVVGTGCSAAQLVPKLPQPPHNAKSVTQLMRSPPWVVPKMQLLGGKDNYEKYALTLFSRAPLLRKLLRFALACGAEYDWRLFGMKEYHEKERKKLEKHLLEHMHKTVPEKYHEILAPDYSVGCKRRIFDETWFPGLNDRRIELTTQPLKEVHEDSVTIGPGQCYPKKSAEEGPQERTIPADAIVLANGFDTTRWLHPLKIQGRDGKDLVGEMEARGGPQAYQGTAMDGFPNFFMIFGPNTATGHSSVVLASENMVEYSLKFVKEILNGDASIIEVKRKAEEAYTQDLQKALKSTVFNSGGCNSWYVDGDWNGTVYGYSQIWFGLRCKFPIWSDWNIRYTTKGKTRYAMVRAAQVAVAALAIITAYRFRGGKDMLIYGKMLVDRLKSAAARSASRSQ